MLPVGAKGSCKISGKTCTVLKHVKSFEDGYVQKVQWDYNGHVGFVRAGRLNQVP